MSDDALWTAFEKVGALLTADDGTNTQNSTRDELLDELVRLIGPDPLVAALWLCEWSEGENNLRLWNIRGQGLSLTDKLFCISMPCSIPRKVDLHASPDLLAAWKGDLAPKLNTRVSACIRNAQSLESELFFLNANRVGATEQVTVGVLQFIGPTDSIARLKGSSRLQKRLISTARSIAGWIQLNRARRLASSILSLTEAVKVSDPIDVLVRNAVKTISEWTNATEVRVYRHRQDGSLDDLAAPDSDKNRIVEDPPLSEDQPLQLAIRQAHFAPQTGPRSVTPAAESAFSVSEMRSAYIVPMGTKGVGPQRTAPFVTVCCFAQPTPAYVGGAFSDTAKKVIEQIADDLSQRLLAMTVSNATHSLSTRSTELISRHMRLVTPAPDLPWVEFLRMAEDAAPSVRRCFFVDPSEPIGRALKSGRLPSRAPDLVHEDLRGRVSPYIHRAANKPSYYIHPIETFAEDRRFLIAELLATELPDFEAGLLDRIATEVRIAHTLAFQPKERLHQLAQVRHNLRGSLNAALSHAEALSYLYESSKDCEPEELKIWLVEKAQFRKGFSKLRAQATQLREMFENIKVAVNDLTEQDCQFAPTNLVELIRLQLDTLDTERERRRLRVSLRDFDLSSRIMAPVDRAYMSLLFHNLIDNAFKYANRESTVEMKFSSRRGFWIFDITNVGQPISGHSKEELWGEFGRVRNEKGRQQMPGTGLGLPAVLKIAKVHHRQAICDYHPQPIHDYNLSDTRSERVTFTVSIPQTR